MTTPEHPSTVALAEDDFDFDDWLETASVARRSVAFHTNLALVAIADAMPRRLAAAERREKAAGERSVGERRGETVESIYAEWEAARAAWDASETVVVVRTPTAEQIRAIQEQHAEPPSVEEPSAEHDQAVEAAATARNTALIHAAIVEFRVGGKPRTLPTLQQVGRMIDLVTEHKSATVGALLLVAVASTKTEELDVPRPTWPAVYGGAPG